MLAILKCFILSWIIGVLADARRLSMKMNLKGNILVVQNKGGGHGTIGFYLAKALAAKNPDLKVSVLQDKCNYKSQPFASYGELKAAGVNVIDADLSKEFPTLENNFDFIVDNWSKNPATAANIIDIAKKSKSKQYVFISSAGMYKSKLVPLVESEPIKDESPVRQVEVAVSEAQLPFTFLRPQYIYGTKSNKRYLDFFISRAVRGVPIPLPLDGSQQVCLTHVEDVGDLIAATLGKAEAINQVFNCGTDKYISYLQLSAEIKSLVGGKSNEYLHYEPKDFPDWDGSGVQEFPFRRETFITSPAKAIAATGWKPKHSLVADLVQEIADYKENVDDKKAWGADAEELKYDRDVIAKNYKGTWQGGNFVSNA